MIYFLPLTDRITDPALLLLSPPHSLLFFLFLDDVSGRGCDPVLPPCSYTHTHTRGRARTHALHYGDVIMGTMASQITSFTIVYSTVYSGADQRKHQSSTLLAFVRGIHRWPVNSPHKWLITQKMFPWHHHDKLWKGLFPAICDWTLLNRVQLCGTTEVPHCYVIDTPLNSS